MVRLTKYSRDCLQKLRSRAGIEFAERGYTVVVAADLAAMREAVAGSEFRFALIDLRMGAEHGLAAYSTCTQPSRAAVSSS